MDNTNSINSRIRLLRKNYLNNLSQNAFAERIGLKQSSASAFEQEGHTVSDRVIKTICHEFNVSEDWLLYGKGDIFVTSDQFDLDTFVKTHNGTELEMKIMKAYFELDKDTRKALIEHFKNYLNGAEL